jgi:HK97 family phage major capsid protein
LGFQNRDGLKIRSKPTSESTASQGKAAVFGQKIGCRNKNRETAKCDIVRMNLLRTLAEVAAGEKRAKVSVNDFFYRAQAVSPATAGGFTVAPTVGPIVEALFPFSAVIRAGAQVLNLKGANRELPKVTASVGASWVAENETVTASSLSFAQLNESPRRLSALVEVSKRLLTQAPEFAPMLERHVRAALGYAIDVGCLNGVGGAEPIGLLQTEGLPEPVTFAGAAALSDLCTAEKTIGDNYAEQGPLTWITSVATRDKWRQVQKWTGSSTALWGDDNKVIGHDAIATPAISNTDSRMLFGAFQFLQIVFFGEIEITIDELTEAKQGMVNFVFNLFADAAPLHSEAFARSTDSAAQ